MTDDSRPEAVHLPAHPLLAPDAQGGCVILLVRRSPGATPGQVASVPHPAFAP